MPTPSAPLSIDVEVGRIRALSKRARYSEALAAAEALAPHAPRNRDVLYLIAANQRCVNHTSEALHTLEQLEQLHPRFSLLFQERGYCCVTLQDIRSAIDAFAQAVTLNPSLISSWAMLERLHGVVGQRQSAANASAHLAVLKRLPAEVVRAAILFSDGDLSRAAHTLRSYLETGRSHVEAHRLLARIDARILLDEQKYLQVYNAIVGLLHDEDRELLSLYAAACVGLGRHERAIEVYRRLLATSPHSAELHVALGHSLQSQGCQTEAIESYHAAAHVRPSFGDAYWSLANLKTYRFSDTQIARMRVEEAASSLHVADRYHLCFALGKAYEDRCEYEQSWHFYERGNALKRAEVHWNADTFEADTRKQIAVCTAESLTCVRLGVPDADPIFIVGLPRSGSTLVEQILASHSRIDGTQELPQIPRIVRELEGTRPDPDTLRTLGESYMTDTRVYRGTKTHFIDKMPNNFRHIGLIHLMLPNATIIDVRREPMACCFSNLKQLFATGQEFTYSIGDIARYYRTYLVLMRHWNEVLPGRILHVCYDDLVDDLESNVRRILEFVGLTFEPACIEFYKQKRNIATASSEQVRQPLFRSGLSQWRNYEPWLASLRDSLGDAVIRYRE